MILDYDEYIKKKSSYTPTASNATTHETGTTRSRAIVQLNAYLAEKVIPVESNIFEYWTQKKNTWPDLYTIAMKYLIIPATSTPSERSFSSSGYTITDGRNRLTPSHAEQIVTLHQNIKVL